MELKVSPLELVVALGLIHESVLEAEDHETEEEIELKEEENETDLEVH